MLMDIQMITIMIVTIAMMALGIVMLKNTNVRKHFSYTQSGHYRSFLFYGQIVKLMKKEGEINKKKGLFLQRSHKKPLFIIYLT